MKRCLPVISITLLIIIILPFFSVHESLSAAGRKVPGRVEAVFYNGRIYTFDGKMSVVGALAVSGGRIAAVGKDEDILGLSHPGTVKYDLKGRTVIPGLVDAHAHFSGFAVSRSWLDLVGTVSLDEIVRLVDARAGAAIPGEWIQGRGWDQNDWETGVFPSRRDIDGVCPENPAILIRVCGHAALVNTVALKMAGIDSSTPDPMGGKIKKDEKGDPTGILIDEAITLVRDLVPEPGRDKKKDLIRDASQACLAVGLTGVHDMGIGSQTASIYMDLYRDEELPIRLTAYYDSDAADIDSLIDAGLIKDFADGRFEVVGVKFYMDGSLGARSAALLDDYSDDPGNRGMLVLDEVEMMKRILDCARRDIPVSVHAIGDRGNRTILDILEKVNGLSGKTGLRHRIEHAQILNPDDIPRFMQIGVIPSMQFTHCTSDMPWAGDRLGDERLVGAYAWRSLMNTGCCIPGGSDFPVESIDPLLGIYAAVTRADLEGNPAGGWFPGQCLTVEEAVRSFTIYAARAVDQKNDRGTLEAGKFADFVVLSSDIMNVAPDDIPSIDIVATIIGGTVEYKSDLFSAQDATGSP
ncbi:MAG: amidohydrolase [Bacteroidales bacterium]|nr:amidohydrolase [Candidatus Latescibacterota bacterium]